MKDIQKFESIMNESKLIALATSVKDSPNVRLVNFILKNNKVYFISDPDDNKFSEFAQNNKVAFSTIPIDMNTHVRVKDAVIKFGITTFDKISEDYFEKYPENKNIPQTIREKMVVCEIELKKVILILGMNDIIELNL